MCVCPGGLGPKLWKPRGCPAPLGVQASGAELRDGGLSRGVGAPGRLSQAALFLVDNKSRSKGLAMQVPPAVRLAPQPSDQGLCLVLCPVGQRTSITAAPGNHGRRPGPSVQPDQRSQTLNLEGSGAPGPCRNPQAKTGPTPPPGAPARGGPRGFWKPGPGRVETRGGRANGREGAREAGAHGGLRSSPGGARSPRAAFGLQGPGRLQLRGREERRAAAWGPVGRRVQTGPLSPSRVRGRGNGISFRPFSPSVSCCGAPCPRGTKAKFSQALHPP